MITLTTPFAGKKHCFDNYYEGVVNLDYPKIDIFALWYDNSNDAEFHAMLEEKIKIFPNHKIVVDDAPHFVIENTSDYAKVSMRCHEVYKAISKLVDGDYMFNVEDDVWVPPDSLKKMLDVFNRYEKVGTVIGSQCSRRLKDFVFRLPTAWIFEQKRVFPFPDTCDEFHMTCLRLKNFPPFGIQIIGSGHMGCWLTPTAIVKEIGFVWEEDGLQANDIVWGYRLGKAGYHFVIDWSIRTRHYHCIDGEKGYLE